MSVRVAGLTKRYGSKMALDRVSFTVDPGTLTAVVGPNGAGKSTLFKVMTNIASGTGLTTYDGVPWQALDNPRRHVGVYLGSAPFYGQMKVRDHLRLVAASCGASTTAVLELLGEFGLERFASARISTLSLGGRQRLGVAAAMIGDPGTLLLDEPFSALDPAEADHVYGWLERAALDGRTVIVSTHNLARIAPLASHALVMVDGKAKAFGRIGELARELKTPPYTEVLVLGSESLAAPPPELRTFFVAGTYRRFRIPEVEFPRLASYAQSEGAELQILTPAPGLVDVYREMT
ncbi:MAG: ATP-binding cassette domain-containing protein [Marmoricola sp.]